MRIGLHPSAVCRRFADGVAVHVGETCEIHLLSPEYADLLLVEGAVRCTETADEWLLHFEGRPAAEVVISRPQLDELRERKIVAIFD